MMNPDKLGKFEPVIAVEFKNQGTLEALVPLYLKSVDDMIRAVSNNPELLHLMKCRVLGMLVEIKKAQDANWARENGIMIKEKTLEERGL